MIECKLKFVGGVLDDGDAKQRLPCFLPVFPTK